MTYVGTTSGHPDQDKSGLVNVCSSSDQSSAGLTAQFYVDPYIEVKGQMEVKVT